MSEQESVVQEPSLPTPGELLKAARETKGLSLEQVASKINLRAHNIEAIENDEDDSNLSTTFTKGYLKLYAKFVDVSETEVLQAFERMNSVAKEPAKLQSFSRRMAKQTSDARLMMVTYFIIAIVIALSVLWWFQQTEEAPVAQVSLNRSSQSPIEQESESLGTSQSVQNDQPVPSNERDTEVDDIAADQNNDLTGSANDIGSLVDDAEELLGETAESLDNGQPSTDSSVELSDVIPVNEVPLIESIESTTEDTEFDSFAAVSVELIFEFADDCWVSVIDSTGETIAIGVKRSGYVMTVPGIPPFEVTLGAPQAVQISMAGDAVDMSQFPAGQTAKFELPLQE